MFFSAQLIALQMVVAGTQAVMPSPREDESEQSVEDIDDDGAAEIVRTTRLEAEPPRETPDKQVRTTGVGAFVVGDTWDEWIESEDAVDTEEYR
jgi:hypothetical protein